MENLAEAIFEAREQPDEPGCPIARWDEQSAESRQRYIMAAQVASIIVSGGAYRVEPITETTAQPST